MSGTPRDGLTKNGVVSALRRKRAVLPLEKWSQWTQRDYRTLASILRDLNKSGIISSDVETPTESLPRLNASLAAFHTLSEAARKATASRCLSSLQRDAIENPLDARTLYALAGRIKRWSDRYRRFETGAVLGQGTYAKASIVRTPAGIGAPAARGRGRGAAAAAAAAAEEACPLEDTDPNSPSAFRLVIKTNLDTDAIEDQIHQALIMLDVTNPVRAQIPNFSFLYHVNDCLPRGVRDDLFTCPDKFGTNVEERVNLFSEFTSPGVRAAPGKALPLSRMIRLGLLDFDLMLSMMLQAVCACSHLASLSGRPGRRINFSHNDLHAGNVLLHTTGKDRRVTMRYKLDTGLGVEIQTDSIAMIIDTGASYAEYTFDGRPMDTPGLPFLPIIGSTPWRSNAGFDAVRLFIDVLRLSLTQGTAFTRHALAYLLSAVFPWLLASSSRRPFSSPLTRRIDASKAADRDFLTREVRLAASFDDLVMEIADAYAAIPPAFDFRVGEFVALVLDTFNIEGVRRR